MKALRFAAFGGVDVLEVDEHAPEPAILPSQLRIDVRAAGLNPVDGSIRKGFRKDSLPQLPVTVGGDFSGIVTAIGDAVTEFKVGDQVYGQAVIINGGSGTCAQVVAANTGNTARMPRNVDFIQAASLPLAGVSAIHALEDLIKLKRGQKVLIHGGSGGIGSLAIQIAKALGARVATTVRSNAKEFAQELGADLVIDYQNESFDKLVSDYDAVVDNSADPDTLKASFRVLKRGGILVSLRLEPDQELAKKYAVIAHRQWTNTNTGHLNRLTELVESGKVRPCIDTIFPLEQAREAFRHLEEDHLRGKVVVKMPD